MEIEYACSVKNRFSAIKDSTDPFEAAIASRTPAAKVEKKKKVKPVGKPSAPAEKPRPAEKAPEVSPPAEKPPKPIVSKSPPDSQSPIPQSPLPSPERPPREPRRPGEFGEMTFHRGRGNRRPFVPQGPPSDFESFQRTEYRRPSGRTQRGVRRFDRHSASNKTTVKPEEKRQGGGAHNWGRADEVVPEEAPAVVEEAPIEEEAPQEQREESPPLMTLDEWDALHQKPARVQQEARKAGEGENPNKWAKPALIIQKKKPTQAKSDESVQPAAQQQNRNSEIESAVRNMFALKPVEQGRGRGFRRGNGGQVFRRGGGRRGYGDRGRREAQSGANYNLKDEDQFPKLA